VDPERKGLVKIGYTNDITLRKKQHKAECGLDVTYIWTSNPMEHCKRIEKLAKLDLRHLCKPWKCTQCHREHREWFKIADEKAIEIVKVWVDWLHTQKPYKYGRLPPRDFVDHDHISRWDHWNRVVLSPLSDSDTRRFHMKQVLSAVLDLLDLPQDFRALMYFIRTAIPVVLLLWVLRR
jgi:hypothetical protein